MSALDTPKDESRVLPAAGAGALDLPAPVIVSADLVELLSEKCDRAKIDLEKNWTYQIISLGVGLGLISGLGALLSKKFFDEVGHERILDILVPMVNLYFFMRFGLLATYFSKTRTALENLAQQYRKQQGLDELFSVISETNSYFEHYHHRKVDFGVLCYSLFVPIVMGGNQGISFFLLYKLTGNVVYLGLYSIPYLLLYTYYYSGNKDFIYMIGRRKIDYLQALIPFAILFGVLVYVFISYHRIDLGSLPVEWGNLSELSW